MTTVGLDWWTPIVAFALLGCGTAAAEDLPVPADAIFVNGTVITMDPDAPDASAIAIAGTRIIAVGSNAAIAAHIGDDTTIINLAGRTVLPGFVDAHSHLFGERIIHGGDPLLDQDQAIAFGVTTTAELYVDEGVLGELRALADAGALRLRVNAYLLATSNCGEPVGDWWKAYTPNRALAPNLFVRGVKIFADGGSCRIPAMSVEYPGGGTGDLFFTQDGLNALVAEIDAAGFQVAIHAAGDRAAEQAQNAIAATLAGRPNTRRHRIEHNSTVRPEMLPRYGEIGIVPVIFGAYPTCIRTIDEGRFKYVLPAAYGAWDWPWRALVDANPGLPIAWHADFPVFGSVGPIRDMWGMVTRRAIANDGAICEPPEWLAAGALRIDEVLPMMTVNSAYALHFETEVGSLQPGKRADLVVLSANPLAVAADDLKDIDVLMTMIGGRVEHCAPSADALCPP